MRMPFPYSCSKNVVQIDRSFGARHVVINLLPIPEDQKFNVQNLEKAVSFADKITQEHERYLAKALEKIQGNHYREHVMITPGEKTCSVNEFKKGLELKSVTLWQDDSWAMIFQSKTGILANNEVCVSFGADRPSFTAIIGK